MGQIWNVVKESKWKHILVELLTVKWKHCSKDSPTVWNGWMVTMQVSNTTLCLNYGNAKYVSRDPDYLSWHPVSATMGFQWHWPKTIIISKEPKETRFKSPFNSSGTVLYDKGCAFVPAGYRTSFFHWYSLVLLLYSRYGNFCLWYFQECFKNPLEGKVQNKLYPVPFFGNRGVEQGQIRCCYN